MKRRPAERAARAAGPMLGRRELLAGGFCLCCLPRSARSAAPSGPAQTEEIAPGVHVRVGLHQDATAENGDAIANAGFIIGRDAVLVADPGGSLADGESLRAAIRATTGLPVRHVVMTHVHPDHVFGAGAFQQDDPEFIGHARLPAALAARGDYYRQRLEEILGPGKAGPVVMPTQVVDRPTSIDLGGRVVSLMPHGIAHTDNDLSLLDRQTGTLFTGDLLFVDRVPSLDGSLKGWLAELDILTALDPARAVPGHGPASVDWPVAAARLRDYLNVLLVETRAAVAGNIGITRAVETVGVGERGKWRLFDGYHGRNVTQAYKELEWE